jgi:hypothetical protein
MFILRLVYYSLSKARWQLWHQDKMFILRLVYYSIF